MAVPISVNVEARIVKIVIDPTDPPQLYLSGVLWDVDRQVVVRFFDLENVTAELGALQLQRLQELVARAQQWVDNKFTNS